MKTPWPCIALVAVSLFARAGDARAGWSEQVLHSFDGTNGYAPYASLVADAAGNLYGTTVSGGKYNGGVVFRLSPPAAGKTVWNETVLHVFGGPGDGAEPLYCNLIFDTTGNLYGTTWKGPGAHGKGAVFELSPPAAGQTAWTETMLYSFQQNPDGDAPTAGLVLDKAGNLYGTTQGGGVGGGYGTVFKLSPPGAGQAAWTETQLYRFRSNDDGYEPSTGLILDAAGNLYGTTSTGGDIGAGTVFQLTPPRPGKTLWRKSILHNFGGADGELPQGGPLAFDAVGNLYGTTTAGGASNMGVVFELTPPAAGQTGWTETVLHSFSGDAYYPYSGVVVDGHGHLYGTTSNHPATSGGGLGVLFKLLPPTAGQSGWTMNELHRFTGRGGANPYGGVLLDAAGNLYGATVVGGCAANGVCGKGVVYKLTHN